MIAHKNWVAPTAKEQARNDLIMGMTCACCALHGDVKERRLELHHIVRSHRLGEWYTLQLCVGHHRGLWAPTDPMLPKYRAHVHGGRYRFRRAHGGYDDLQIWQRQQVVLGYDDALPPSKIFKRQSPQTEAEVSR
jgi:hypothetical protein